MYHSIDPSGSVISLDRDTFARHVEWMATAPVTVVGLTELLSGDDDANALAITFDDGFANFATDAWPLLRDHGLPATQFIVADRAGGTNAWEDGTEIPVLPLMDWDTLGRLSSEGLGLGVHGRTHRPLEGLSAAELEDELGGCVERIAERTGTTPTTMAYPYGRFDDDAVEAARASFAAACTTELRLLTRGEDALLLPRLDAYYFRTGDRLRGWGRSTLRRYVAWRGAARRLRSKATALLRGRHR